MATVISPTAPQNDQFMTASSVRKVTTQKLNSQLVNAPTVKIDTLATSGTGTFGGVTAGTISQLEVEKILTLPVTRNLFRINYTADITGAGIYAGNFGTDEAALADAFRFSLPFATNNIRMNVTYAGDGSAIGDVTLDVRDDAGVTVGGTPTAAAIGTPAGFITAQGSFAPTTPIAAETLFTLHLTSASAGTPVPARVEFYADELSVL